VEGEEPAANDRWGIVSGRVAGKAGVGDAGRRKEEAGRWKWKGKMEEAILP
jgi:hypothetical protein